MNVFSKVNTDLEGCSQKEANLFFITRQQRSLEGNRKEYFYQVRKTEISSVISTSLIDNFIDGINVIKELEKEVVNYEISLSDNEYIQKIMSSEIPNAEEIKEKILNPEMVEVLSSTDINNVWAYAVLIRYDNQRIMYFRKYSKGKILKKGVSNAMMFKDGSFKNISDYDVFRIDDYIDCIYYEGEVYIIHSGNFERIFGFETQYETAAKRNLGIIAEGIIEEDGISVLQALIEKNSNNKRKLASISGEVIEKYKEIDVVRQTVEDYDLDVQINGVDKIIVQPDNASTVIKMFNDNYLKSEATDIRYEATSKRRVGRRRI
ncbi:MULTISPECIES: Kiwa anti-phage protein KwaB-like domain-containing protein [Bacillus]|uniref:Kiwa anti-phage protein KwaB-like domain-containing protein n=1 Tax=Bacillus TaxID=1386 RepID=UPI00094BEBEE|nr:MULTISPECIES: Kiwa anti-phage protein KwaB-like domain-containing protein [Bacillus]MEC0902421.1 DUF4868 domain-containing protein [Bacillus anthracis]